MPSYNGVLPLLSGIVTDFGGALCHAAIVAREYGIPAVVNTRFATSTIADGATIEIDGDKGTVRILV
jgi:pyruvate,water dikinase